MIIIIIMKTVEFKAWENNWQIKWAEMTANMQYYNNPQLPRRGGRGDVIPKKTVTKCSANHRVKYRRATRSLGRPLTVYNGPAFDTTSKRSAHVRTTRPNWQRDLVFWIHMDFLVKLKHDGKSTEYQLFNKLCVWKCLKFSFTYFLFLLPSFFFGNFAWHRLFPMFCFKFLRGKLACVFQRCTHLPMLGVWTLCWDLS